MWRKSLANSFCGLEYSVSSIGILQDLIVDFIYGFYSGCFLHFSHMGIWRIKRIVNVEETLEIEKTLFLESDCGVR